MSGIQVLEQAFHRCRKSPGGAIAAYLLGTAPFVTALLYFFADMGFGSDPATRLFPAAFGLAALWVWMNAWQSVFCHKLRCDMSGESPARWTWRTCARLAVVEAAVHGPALIIVPIAAIAVLPFGWVYAFFQNCHVFATGCSLEETRRRASEQAAMAQEQNWQLLGCAALLAAAVFLNVMFAFLFGAQLLHSVFGVQTAIVRNQFAIFHGSLIGVAAAITYLAVDPVVKAAYVIRCFEGESGRTGADLRLIFSRAFRLAVFLFIAAGPADAATKEQYDTAIEQALQRPEYAWRQPRTVPADDIGALQRTLDTLGDWVERSIEAIGTLLRKITGGPQRSSTPPPSGANVRVPLILAALLVAVGIAFIAFRYFTKQPFKIVAAESTRSGLSVDVSDESVTPSQLREDEWFQLADRLLATGQNRLALRAFFLGALAQLHTENLITLDSHKTNLEYARELARRARAFPHVHAAFRDAVRIFEGCWYGTVAVDESVVGRLKSSLPGLRAHA